MDRYRKQLMNQMAHFDNYESDNLESVGNPQGSNIAQVNQVAGNPAFKASFNLQISQVYYNQTGAAVVLPAALPAALQVSNPVYVFGFSDKQGGYDKAQGNIPFVNGGAGFWNFLEFGVIGVDTLTTPLSNFPTAVRGDLVFVSTAVNGGNTYTRTAIIHCPQVAYGTLLSSLASDTFFLNMIRYVVDPTLTVQLTEQINYFKQTMFGKTGNDSIDPQTYITGGTYNRNIADIPVEMGVDKSLVLGTQIQYNVQRIDWTITVFSAQKLTAKV